MSMDALASPDCLQAFLAMGGINVHMILPMPKFYRLGRLVTVGKTGIFVGNMGDRFPAGPKEGTAARIIVLPVSIADKSVDMGESVDELYDTYERDLYADCGEPFHNSDSDEMEEYVGGKKKSLQK
jgi:hypothetical protein